MTIDEAIENYQKDSQFYNDKFELYLAEEYRQLAEWLEELKALKEEKEYWDIQNHKAYNQGRADVLDEFLKELYPCKYKYNDDCFLCKNLAHCRVFIAERIADRLKEQNNEMQTL